jgi:hypothetical protein
MKRTTVGSTLLYGFYAEAIFEDLFCIYSITG